MGNFRCLISLNATRGLLGVNERQEAASAAGEKKYTRCCPTSLIRLRSSLAMSMFIFPAAAIAPGIGIVKAWNSGS